LADDFETGNWAQHLIPAAEALGDWPAVELNADEFEKVRNGNRIPAKAGASGQARAINEQGELVAIIEVDGDEWHPRKVFFTT
jgi:tRNA pseudouridine55 synthase